MHHCGAVKVAGLVDHAPDDGLTDTRVPCSATLLKTVDARHHNGFLRNIFPAPLGDTPEAVSSLALSPDGRTLAVGGDSGTLQLWDVASQQPLGGPITTAGDPVASLAFSGDSTTLYAAGLHVPLQRYTVDPDRAADEVCDRIGGGLTKTQWRTYVPDVSYRKICGG